MVYGSPTSCPQPIPDTVVHGDYRLGNLMVERNRPDRVQAVLDWEMGAIGDPRADLGYLLATYAEPARVRSPLGVSPVTTSKGFPMKAELVERYVERSGREVGLLAWFEALALWSGSGSSARRFWMVSTASLQWRTRAAAFEDSGAADGRDGRRAARGQLTRLRRLAA